jgi:lipid-binding SYLF domain-containing protein
MPIKPHSQVTARAVMLALCLTAGAVQAGGEPAAAGVAVGAGPTQRATERVAAAIEVVHQLESAPRMKQLLQQAKGVLIVPSFGRAALGVGAQGGGGVLLLKRADEKWSGPAFYDIGGLSLGLQAGVQGGAIAMILNNDKAVDEFMKKNNLALSADAGLTVVNWSKLAEGMAGTGDVVAWSAAKGLFGDVVAVGLHDIRFNEKLTNAYYGRALSPRDIAAGSVDSPAAQALQRALAQASASSK